jgi:molecular chaperone DnaK
MAADNKTLGRFALNGIMSAPRGVPQIEVTFDIDANGIVNVSAKDLATGKAQQITITGSTALSDDEVNKMVKDAEDNAETDKARKHEAEVKNNGDATLHSVRESIKEAEGKVDSSIVADVNKAADELEQALNGGNVATIEEKTEAARTALYKLSEQLYAQASPQGSAEQQTSNTASNTSSDDVMEADYEVVDD